MAVEARGRRIATVTLQSALVGICYSAAVKGHVLVGAAVGGSLGAAFSFLEAVVISLWARSWLNRLPFLVYFGLRLTIYFTLVMAANLAAVELTGAGMGGDSGVQRDIAFALVVCVALNLLLSVNELLGPGALFAFAAGRYRRPRSEERVLLYLDLCGSTAIAERLGEERFLDLLNAFLRRRDGGDRQGGRRDPQICRRRGDRDLAARDRSDPADPRDVRAPISGSPIAPPSIAPSSAKRRLFARRSTPARW